MLTRRLLSLAGALLLALIALFGAYAEEAIPESLPPVDEAEQALPASSEAPAEVTPLVIRWLDDAGTEQETDAEWVSGEGGGFYRVELSAEAMPALTVTKAGDSAEETGAWLLAAYLGDADDGAGVFSVQDGEPDGFEATLYIYIRQPLAVTPAPSPDAVEANQVMVIVHYETPDGTPIADDDVIPAQRGTQVQVFTSFNQEGWTALSDPIQYVDVPAEGPDVIEVVFQYTQPTPTPAPPEVKVTIHYRDEGGSPVADDTVASYPGGTEAEIRAVPENLKENYYPYSDSVQRVQLNSSGTPQEVTFYYTYQPPATPAPAYVIIRYLNEADEPVAADTTMTGAPGQEMVVYAAPEQLQADYVLDDEESRVVVFPDDGQPLTVVFRYRYEMPETPVPTATPEPPATATPQPAPGVALVQVSYVYQGDDSLNYSEPVTVYQGQTYLSAQEGQRSGYQLISDDNVLVTVNENGVAEPNRVTFLFAPVSAGAAMPELVINYLAEDGTPVATATLLTLRIGENTVYAAPVDLQEGYEQITPSCTVTVDSNGQPDQQSVIFYYRKTSGDTAEEDGFQVVPASGFARSNNASINLRSYPSTSSDSTIVAKINKTDIIEIHGKTEHNGTWYLVSVNERRGYVSASVITLLSDEEVAILQGLYFDDGSGESPVDPETGLIERWGQVNKKVNVRKEPGGKVITELKRNSMVFVDEPTDVDGTLWYRIRYGKNKEAYVMAEFITLYSAAESQAYQFSLPTAVPTHTVPATRIPTSTPTPFVPTPTPTAVPLTPTPVVTETPVPYTGYAITTNRATVYSGLQADKSSMVTLNGDTLVIVQGQTYVNGVCWDSIRVISSGMTGFVEDRHLTHVSNEVAEEYIEIQATATPAPTPDNTPLPFTGLATVRMDGVPLRQQTNSNAQFLAVLNTGSVVYVLSQTTTEDGFSWCLVQSGQYLGYVRRDLIREMTIEEIIAYNDANKSRPTPTPAVTATPRAQSAMASCWGIISRAQVSLRARPNAESMQLRLMSRNEFVQVQGSFLGDDGLVWLQVLANGQTGYLRDTWVEILTQGQLTSVVTSDDFKSANTTDTTVTGADSIQPYENYLVNQDTNPSPNTAYEPFNPYTAPPVSASAQTAAGNQTPSPTMPPTPVPTIINNMSATPAPEAAGGSHLGGVLIGAAILAIGGGVAFSAYAIHDRKRRQALRRAQALRRRQRQAESAPEEPSVSAPSSYRRDSGSGIAMQSIAKPVPTGETAKFELHHDEAGAETQAFRRPARRINPDEAFSAAGQASHRPAVTREEPSAPETPVQNASEAPGRRRRSERHQYDKDGN